MKVLVTYISRHGSTQGIAERIAEGLRGAGTEVGLHPIQDVGGLDGYDAVVLGSAVYFGSWLKPALEFARGHQAELVRRPVWIFSSGPVGAAVLPPPKETAELLEALHPRDHRVFAGALDAGRLSLSERLVTRMVHAPMTDSRSWEEIDSWTSGIAAQLLTTAMVAR